MRCLFPLLLTLPLAVPLAAQDVHVRVSPTVKTGIEATAEFPTIQMALDHHPVPPPNGRVIIEIAPGTYRERVIVTRNHPRVTLLGMGKSPAGVVITNSLNAKQAGGTFFTETVKIEGDGFQADNLTIENTAPYPVPEGGQAVAAAVRADRVVFKHCRLLGHQDTLYADFGRQYYTDSYIEGGVDFLFGNAAAVFDRTELHANGPGYLTAHSRTAPDQPTGYVILHSRVTSGIDHTANPAAHTSLGRPWRPFARVVFIDTALPEDLDPAGWNNWGKASNEATAFFAESASTGPGARPASRVPWSHQLTPAEAAPFLPAAFLRGSDGWDPEADTAKLP